MDFFNQEKRFGSARWATEKEIAVAGLFRPRGPLLGYVGRRQVRLESDAPIITIGGAGSGKARDLVIYNTSGCQIAPARWYGPPRMLVNDSRGELAAVSLANQVRLGKTAYCVNPHLLHGLPCHKVNPLDILKPGAKTLHANAKLIASFLLTLSGSSNAEYFELRGRSWVEAWLLLEVERCGMVTLPQLYDLVREIEDPRRWPDVGEAMLNSAIPEVVQTAIEIHSKREDAPKEYSAIMGEIQKALSFLSDPVVRACLNGADFSLEVLCQRDCTVFNMIPAEYATILAPMNRLIFGVAMLYKYSHPAAPTVTMLIDEAATLGKFDALLTGYTYGRGMGIRMWSIWQDTGQISRSFGPGALSSFLGSSQVRQFFGVRDLETARLVSSMLGNETLEYDPIVEQAGARRDLRLWAHQIMNGGDPFDIGLNASVQAVMAVTPVKQMRPLMTPDEILNMPEDRQILFISGLNLPPVYASKYPYFTRPEMAGGYMPNPYHPPGDRVRVAGGFGSWARVVTGRVPARYAAWPQYQSGQWSYIAGYRPF